MPKKQKKNPYIYFCLEKKQIDGRLKNKTLPELVALCSQEWDRLSLEEKKPYVETAKQMADGRLDAPPVASSASSKTGYSGKFDAFGRSLLRMEAERKQEKCLEKLIQNDIKRIVNSEMASEFRFHIMTVNHWLEFETTGEVIPVEIAMVEMSLRNGIMKKFVQFIDPGEIPPGYKAEMKINAEKFHDVWLDNPELVDCYRDVIEKIKDTLWARPDEQYAGEGLKFSMDKDVEEPTSLAFARFHRLLPIYVVPDDKAVVSKSLKWLVKQLEPQKQLEEEYNFLLYDLVFLFQQLVNSAPFEPPTKMSMGAAESHLMRDVFLYLPSMSCRYHHKIESSKCAGARASRFAYIICDFCCQTYQIKPKEGAHLPHGISPEQVVYETPSSSRNSSFASNSLPQSNSRASQEINFVADSISANYTRHDELPAHAEPSAKFPHGSIDAFHILQPYLSENQDGRFVFKSVVEMLSEEEPVDLVIENPDPRNDSTFSLLNSSHNQELNSFFDNAPLHPVMGNRYPFWHPGRSRDPLSDSYATAAEDN